MTQNVHNCDQMSLNNINLNLNLMVLISDLIFELWNRLTQNNGFWNQICQVHTLLVIAVAFLIIYLNKTTFWYRILEISDLLNNIRKPFWLGRSDF